MVSWAEAGGLINGPAPRRRVGTFIPRHISDHQLDPFGPSRHTYNLLFFDHHLTIDFFGRAAFAFHVPSLDRRDVIWTAFLKARDFALTVSGESDAALSFSHFPWIISSAAILAVPVYVKRRYVRTRSF